MNTISFSRSSVLKALGVCALLVAVAWQIPFSATADDEKLDPVASALTVSCVGTPNPAKIGEPVTWKSTVFGGNNSYTYAWTGNGTFSENAPGGVNGPTVTTSYGAAGTKNAHVTVTSGTQSVTADCDPIEVEAPAPAALSVSCKASPDPVQINTEVTWSANATGGAGDYWYTWTGDGNFPGPQHSDGQQNVVAVYGNAGVRTATVTVTSHGQTATKDCTVTVRDNNPPPPPPTCSEPTQDWEIRQIREQMQFTFDLDHGTASVTNPTNCAYPFALKSFKVDDEDPHTPQIFFDADTKTVGAHQTATFQVDIPSCRYQLDLVIFPDTGYTSAKLLKGDIKMGLNLCTTTTPPPPPPTDTCVPDPRNDLVDALGRPFNPYDGSSITTGGNGATVTVHNRSTSCGYNVGLSSYKTGTYVVGQEQQFINGQTLFGEDYRRNNFVGVGDVGPGETVTLQVPVPACNWQTDLYTFADNVQPSPVPPDFAALEHTGNYTLLDFLQDLDNGACGEVNQCLAQPTITSTIAPTTTLSIGASFSYTVTTTGGTAPIAVSIAPVDTAAPGLTINGSTISGTVTTVGTYHYEVTARGADSAPSCAAVQRFTIIVQGGGGSCPAKPTITSTPNTTAAIGQSYNYTVTTNGGVAPVTVTIAPVGPAVPGLTVNGATLSGTIGATASGTYHYTVTATSAGSNVSCAVTQSFSITIGGTCPVTAPVLEHETDTVTGTAGVRLSYTIRLSNPNEAGKVAYSIISGVLPPGLSLNGNEISGMPTQAADATVIIGVNNECGNDKMTLRIIISGQCVPPTITSSGSRSGVVGEPFTYTVSTSGGSGPVTVSIEGTLPHGLTFTPANDTISGTPTESGTFDVLIRAQVDGEGAKICSATMPLRITIGRTGDDDDDDDNHGDDDDDNGGGGHRRKPNVVLFSEPEVLGASISLSQVPYTGLGTSILQVALFIIGLFAISAGIVYALARKLRRSAEQHMVAPQQVTNASTIAVHTNDDVSLDIDVNSYEEEYARVASPVHAPARPAPAPQTAYKQAAPAPKAPATAMPPAALASVMQEVAPQAPKAAVPAASRVPEEKFDPARLQTEARASRTLVSDDGAELIAHSAEGDEKRSLERLAQVIEIAKTRFPREDGWLILDKDRVRESLFISTLSMIPLFVEWIVRGEDKKVFTFLRMLKHQEQPVADFMRKVVAELDAAHRARLEGAEERARTNVHIAEVTYHLSNKELEAIVAELLHGVDERYDSAYTSVRLSLIRVLDIVKERSLRAVGTAYAFSGDRETA